MISASWARGIIRPFLSMFKTTCCFVHVCECSHWLLNWLVSEWNWKLLKKSQQPLQHEMQWKNWSQNDNVDIFTSICSATATTVFAACVLCWKSHFSLSFLVGNYNHCICCLQFRHSCYVTHPCGSVSWKNLFYFTIMLVVMCSKLFGYHGFPLSQFRFYKFKLCLWSSNAGWINFHQSNKTGKWAHHSSRDLQSADA